MLVIIAIVALIPILCLAFLLWHIKHAPLEEELWVEEEEEQP